MSKESIAVDKLYENDQISQEEADRYHAGMAPKESKLKQKSEPILDLEEDLER